MHQVPGEGRQSGGQTDGLRDSGPRAEYFCTCWRSGGCGVGPRPAEKPTRTASRPSRAGGRSSASRRWRPWSAGRWARSCSRYPAYRPPPGQHDPAPALPPGAQRALGRRHYPPTELDAVIRLIDRITRRCAWPTGTGRTVVLRYPVRRLHPGHPLAHAARGHRVDRAAAGRGARPGGGGRPLTPVGSPWIGFAVSNIDRGGAQQLELPWRADPDLLDIDAAGRPGPRPLRQLGADPWRADWPRHRARGAAPARLRSRPAIWAR